MQIPIYIVAGQSNATGIQDNFRDALLYFMPAGSYVYDTYSEPGAPLTLDRSQGGDWFPGSELRESFLSGIVALLASNSDYYLADVFWFQGEGDTWARSASDYAEDLIDLVNELSTEIQAVTGFDPDFNFHVIQLSDQAGFSATRTYWQTVQDQQALASEMHDQIHLINIDQIAENYGLDAEAMFIDNVHYSEQFQSILAANLIGTTLTEVPSGATSFAYTKVNAKSGFWVSASEATENTEFIVEMQDDCSGVRADLALGDNDILRFKDSVREDWVVEWHRDDTDRLVFYAQDQGTMFQVDNARNIETWVFADGAVFQIDDFFVFA